MKTAYLTFFWEQTRKCLKMIYIWFKQLIIFFTQVTDYQKVHWTNGQQENVWHWHLLLEEVETRTGNFLSEQYQLLRKHFFDNLKSWRIWNH